MIKRLKWDSDFFGYEIGMISIANSIEFNFEVFKNNSRLYKLVYVISDQKLNDEHLSLVDTKLTFLKKPLELIDYDKHLTIFNKDEDDFNTLEKLALTSGKYSRFKKDLNFKNNEYESLYKKWISNSVYEGKAISVIIYKEDDSILGFTTLERKEDSLCDICLVAVDKNARGKKIGTKLINFTSHLAFKNGFKNIQVVTQLDNSPAMNLYKNCGFKKNKMEFIYHYWNL